MVGMQLESVLGHGAKSTVYCVTNAADFPSLPPAAYCKIYKKAPSSALATNEEWRGYYREKAALEKLNEAGVLFIPQIVSDALSSDGEHVLVLTSEGLPFLPVPGGVRAGGMHFGQLVMSVERMHGVGVLHRDIKPENAFLVGSNLVLADMDSAVILDRAVQPTAESANEWVQGKEFLWIGTEGYSDTRPIGPESRGMHIPTAQHDMVAVVRTVYTLFTQDRPRGSTSADVDFDYENYWKQVMPASSMWGRFLQLAESLNYDGLRTELQQLVGWVQQIK